MPTKREVLDLLTRDELARLVEEHGVIVGGRAKGHLADRLAEKGPPLPALLASLPRDRLKVLCRKLGLDDAGREKAGLLARLANILRGSPVDRTDWKSYILPLLFFKRVCDVWDEEHAAMLGAYGEDFADEHRFQIPEGCYWNDVRAATKNVGTALKNAMHGLESANERHLYGVFGDAQWSNKDRLPDDLLKDLVEHFSALPLGNGRVASDVIGDAYEYLIKQFADATNKKAGEFYTPRSVVRLMVDMLDPRAGETRLSWGAHGANVRETSGSGGHTSSILAAPKRLAPCAKIGEAACRDGGDRKTERTRA